MYKLISYIFIFFNVIHFANVEAASQDFKWPNDAKAAVNLAYDDALNSQLDIAIPQLDKYNFKGSFYLILGAQSLVQRLEDWRAIARNGHELGNHTVNHACRKTQPNTDWVKDWNDLDKRTIEEMQHEIRVANTFLTAIDGKTTRTFTAPCGQWQVADGNYLDAVKSEFIAMKTTISSQPQPLSDINAHNVHVVPPSNVTGQQLITFVKQAAEMGTIANFTFHGVGGDHLKVSADAHQELLAYLHQNRDTYWVDTFANIMTYLSTTQKPTTEKK